MGFPNLGIALGASADEFNNQRRMAREDERFRLERDRMMAEEQDRQKAREAADQYSSSIQDAGTMAGLPGQLRERVAKGELSQDEANNALAAYRSAGYDPTSLRKKATLGLAAIDPGKAALVQKALHEQAKADLMGELSPLLLKKDYAGIAKRMSDNSFYSDGNEYHFTGQAKDKDGRNHVGFAIRDAKGNVVGTPMAVAEEDFPAFVEASIDPTKGVEYSRMLAAERKADQQHKSTERRLDNQEKLLEKQLAVSQAAAARAERDQQFQDLLRAPLINEMRGYQLGAKEARKAGLGHAASLYDQAQADAVRRYATQNQPEKPRYHFNVVNDPNNPSSKIVVSGDMYTGEARPAVGGKAEAGTEVSKPKTRAEADKYWPSYENSGRFKSKEEFYKALGL